jgi:hypothetical protein
VLLFVGITWSNAGAFQLLSNGGSWLLDRAVKAAWIPDGLVAPRPHQPVDCSAAVQGMQTRALDETTLRHTRVAAYQLGFDLGLFSGARNSGSRVQEPPSLLQERDRLARELAVPLPAIPPMRRLADALNEFEAYVTQDPECIGARLSAGYTREHDALRWAFVGHSVTYRGMAPEVGPLFVPALRRYGQAAGLPERVWRPLAEPSSQKAGPQAWAEGSAIADGILAHLRGEEPGSGGKP